MIPSDERFGGYDWSGAASSGGCGFPVLVLFAFVILAAIWQLGVWLFCSP